MGIDASKFSTNERPNEYEAVFRIEGEIRVTINADSLEDAKAKAAAMLGEDDFGTELDEVTDAYINHVWKSPTMYRVTRDGKTMQVSRLLEGDEPRQPDERGF